MTDLTKRKEIETIYIKGYGRRPDTTIPISDIYYFKSDDKYTQVCYSKGSPLIITTLVKLEPTLPPNFIRINRNLLVNKFFVLRTDSERSVHERNWYVVMQNNDKLKVSRRNQKTVRRSINLVH